jgi:DNA-binding transcriptional ArsR family regulator
MNQATTDRILFALFCLSRDTRHIDASELARAAGVSPTLAAEGLVALERAGLVDASRARLTMLGLARAVKLSAAGGGQPGVDLRHAKPRRAPRTALAAAPATDTTQAPQAPEARESDEDDRLGHAHREERCTLQ